ncbi:MAG: DUF547 domain-containing protein [Chitinivibrionales bacterium]|nr:DUF547 domain-containing protein [Chitinivibrionales bacterium]
MQNTIIPQKSSKISLFLPLIACIHLCCSGTIDLTENRSFAADNTNLSFITNSTDTLMNTYVSADRGLVNYEALWKNPLLKELVDSIAAFDLSIVQSPRDSLAYWINSYNILVIYHLQNYGLTPQPQHNFKLFSQEIAVSGIYMTLDKLEKGENPSYIKKFNEPRTHFALVCAALSCPPLINRAYTGDSLYAMLDRNTFKFINNNEFNMINQSTGSVRVSMLFNWYASDFEGFVRDTLSATGLSRKAGGTVKDFIASYLDNESLKKTVLDATLEFAPYDWTVNNQ